MSAAGAADTVVLILSGGNALGAYQAGAYQALHDRGIRPAWIVGASTGAINGAIIAGNAPDDRLARLADYWRPEDARPAALPWWEGMADEFRRTAAASASLMFGQPNVFGPRVQSWDLGDHRDGASLFETAPLRRALDRLVDFDRLNAGPVRFAATAVDLESGEVVAFDTARTRVAAEHVRASGALLPAFPPVAIDGRLFGDGGLAANLPVDLVLADPPGGTTLCIAVDLLPLAAPRPRTLGEAASRMQDLMFASQSRRSIAAWQQLDAARGDGAARSITLLHIAYDRQVAEVAGKAFDFSPRSARARWDAGHDDVAAALDRVADGTIALGRPGLSVWRPEDPAGRS